MPRVHFLPIDQEQPSLPVETAHFDAVPFPGDQVILQLLPDQPSFEVRVIRRTYVAKTGDVFLYVRVLPPRGAP